MSVQPAVIAEVAHKTGIRLPWHDGDWRWQASVLDLGAGVLLQRGVLVWITSGDSKSPHTESADQNTQQEYHERPSHGEPVYSVRAD